MSNNEIKTTNASLQNIRKISCSFNEIPQEIIKLNDINFFSNINIDTNFDIKILMEEHISFIISVVYEYQHKKNKFVLFNFKYAFDFYIDNFNSLIKKNGKNVDISSHVLYTFFSISYSTSRGLIFSETKGTYLEKIYLPIIDSKKYIEEKFKDYIIKPN